MLKRWEGYHEPQNKYFDLSHSFSMFLTKLYLAFFLTSSTNNFKRMMYDNRFMSSNDKKLIDYNLYSPDDPFFF